MSLSVFSETLKALKWKNSNDISVVALQLLLSDYERHFGIYVMCLIFLFYVDQIRDFSADYLKICK
jgi:hypothetical protein